MFHSFIFPFSLQNVTEQSSDEMFRSLRTELEQKTLELEMKEIEMDSHKRKIECLLKKVSHLNQVLKNKPVEDNCVQMRNDCVKMELQQRTIMEQNTKLQQQGVSISEMEREMNNLKLKLKSNDEQSKRDQLQKELQQKIIEKQKDQILKLKNEIENQNQYLNQNQYQNQHQHQNQNQYQDQSHNQNSATSLSQISIKKERTTLDQYEMEMSDLEEQFGSFSRTDEHATELLTDPLAEVDDSIPQRKSESNQFLTDQRLRQCRMFNQN
jgi:hypothetical protein